MTPPIRLDAPSRLHFGLLGWGAEATRQFGSIGLMIRDPGLEVEARPAESFSAEGPLAGRAVAVARQVAEALRAEGTTAPPLSLAIRRSAPEHVGLGTGTQLSLAVAALILTALDEADLSVGRLARLTGRGLRSGIGLHGFLQGGLLVDGGRGESSPFPPLLARLDIPTAWSILLVIPQLPVGLSGRPERETFLRLPDVPTPRIDRICRLALLGMLPAVAEGDLPAFGSALAEVQREVGLGFTTAQGGPFAHPRLASIAEAMSRAGLHGVGQSSWGPTLYGFSDVDAPRRADIAGKLIQEADLDPAELSWTKGSSRGVLISQG